MVQLTRTMEERVKLVHDVKVAMISPLFRSFRSKHARLRSYGNSNRNCQLISQYNSILSKVKLKNNITASKVTDLPIIDCHSEDKLKC